MKFQLGFRPLAYEYLVKAGTAECEENVYSLLKNKEVRSTAVECIVDKPLLIIFASLEDEVVVVQKPWMKTESGKSRTCILVKKHFIPFTLPTEVGNN